MSEEKKFAVLLPISIQRCAEANGIDTLETEITEALAEDASYRIREIVNIAAQFMKRSRRNRLQVKDVSKALKIANIPPTVGEDHSQSVEYEYMEEGDIYCIKDDVINLETLKVAGQEESDVMNVEESSASPELSSKWFLLDGQTSQESSSELPSVLMDYFNYIVTCILGEDKELQHESLSDLRKSSKIFPLLPYFVTFISNVKAVSHDLEQLSNLLQTATALASNPFINLIGYLKPLTSSVLYCVLESLTASINPLNDHWKLRDYGGRLLAFIVQKYGSQSSEVADYITDSVKSVLLDPTKPLCSHYGAVVTINSLGVSAIKTLLCPSVLNYYTNSLKIIEEITDSNNLQLKVDAYKVVGVILQAIEKMITDLKNGHSLTDELYGICEALFLIFGDALTSRIRINFPHRKGIIHIQNGNYDRMQFGPRMAKLTPIPRRTRNYRYVDIFGPNRVPNKKLSISIGGRLKTQDSPQLYTHSQYFNLCLKTTNVGKCYCLTKKRQVHYLHDYIFTSL
ncbi:TAF6-like RNA polymerase II p300/CBP-associated factor-associated factor 65 kDa subunit 6L [Styela clava]